VQLNTRTKLFCGDAVRHDAQPNRDVCPVCLGLPGALPVVNERAVELAVRAAAMLGADVHRRSRFVRKNYFYPDLPKGYQITQLNEPIATGGMIRIGGERSVRISRLHIEEDAGKLLHDRVKNCSAVDLNRCGIPLLEIVTEPELHDAAEAVRAAKELKRVMQYAGISDCDMELGSLRVDANVSLSGQRARGEIKNVNSFAHLERAINAEIERQTARLASSATDHANETVTWDEHHNALRVMRTKEAREDYRYFDEPDLPALIIDESMFEEAIADLPDSPHETEARFASLGLPDATVSALAATRPLAEDFDDVSARGVSAHDAAAWILTHVLAWCNAQHCAIDAYPVRASTLANVVARVGSRTLTRDGARQVLKALEDGESDIDGYIDRHGLVAGTDDGRLNEWIDEVISSENELVERYRGGDSNLFGFLMGKLMKRAGTSLDPRVASERLKERLQKEPHG
jgi:aspartyl-tRNA(Asn)/glutamyl-tRNA(Gln) amidotransferase subunit B